MKFLAVIFFVVMMAAVNFVSYIVGQILQKAEGDGGSNGGSGGESIGDYDYDLPF